MHRHCFCFVRGWKTCRIFENFLQTSNMISSTKGAMQTLHIFGKTLLNQNAFFSTIKTWKNSHKKCTWGGEKRKPLGFSHQDRISSAPKSTGSAAPVPFRLRSILSIVWILGGRLRALPPSPGNEPFIMPNVHLLRTLLLFCRGGFSQQSPDKKRRKTITMPFIQYFCRSTINGLAETFGDLGTLAKNVFPRFLGSAHFPLKAYCTTT